MQFSIKFDVGGERIQEPYQATSGIHWDMVGQPWRRTNPTASLTRLRSNVRRHSALGCISKEFLEFMPEWRTTFTGNYERFAISQFSNPVVDSQAQYETIGSALHENDRIIRKKFTPVLTSYATTNSTSVNYGLGVIPFLPSDEQTPSEIFLVIWWSNWVQNGFSPQVGDVFVWYNTNGTITVGRCRVDGRIDADAEYDLTADRDTESEIQPGDAERWLYTRFDAIATGQILITGATKQYLWEVNDGNAPFPTRRFGFHFYTAGNHMLQLFPARFANTGFFAYEKTMLRDDFRSSSFTNYVAHSFLGASTAAPTATLNRATDLDTPINNTVDTNGLYQFVSLPSGFGGSALVLFSKATLPAVKASTSVEPTGDLSKFTSSVDINATINDPYYQVGLSMLSNCEDGDLGFYLTRAYELQYRDMCLSFKSEDVTWIMEAPDVKKGNDLSLDELTFNGKAAIWERLNTMITDPVPFDGQTITTAINELLELIKVDFSVQTNSLVLPYTYGKEQPTTSPSAGETFYEYISSLIKEYAPDWYIVAKPFRGSWKVFVGDASFISEGEDCVVTDEVGDSAGINVARSIVIEEIETEANELFVTGYNERTDEILQERRKNASNYDVTLPVDDRSPSWSGFRQVVGVVNSKLKYQPTVKSYADKFWPIISKRYKRITVQCGILIRETVDPEIIELVWVGDKITVDGEGSFLVESIKISIDFVSDGVTHTSCTYTGRSID